jgi:hypothetical protein
MRNFLTKLTIASATAVIMAMAGVLIVVVHVAKLVRRILVKDHVHHPSSP